MDIDQTKARTYKLCHDNALHNCLLDIRACGLENEYEVIVRPIKQQKTLAMLGALFGVWSLHLESQTGRTKDWYHRFWKSRFLSKIYVHDHMDDSAKAYPPEIDSWVELLAIYQEAQLEQQFKTHSKRISLSWANLDQMKRYMQDIENYYIEKDEPLPIPDKFHKFYKKNE